MRKCIYFLIFQTLISITSKVFLFSTSPTWNGFLRNHFHTLLNRTDFYRCIRYTSLCNVNSSKWFRREHAELDAVSQLMKHIMDVINIRMLFDTPDNHLLPRKPRFNYRHLMEGIHEFHSKYVFCSCGQSIL